MDIILHYFQSESCDIHLNHADLLDAIWTWAGIRPEHRQKVAEVLNQSAMSSGLAYCVSELTLEHVLISCSHFEASFPFGFFAPSIF